MFKSLRLFSLFLILNFSYNAFANLTSNSCNLLAGSWSGRGEVKDHNCHYIGTGFISGDEEFETSLYLEREGFSLLCPKQITKTITGKCNNSTGKLVIKDENLDLTGIIDIQREAIFLHLIGKITDGIFNYDVEANLQKE